MMRLNDHGGLACTETTWALVALVVVAWLVLPAIALMDRGRWRGMPVSLLGFAWLGFGADFVVRFFLLAWDSVEFGNDTFRLADLGTATVDQALGLSLLYWTALVFGVWCWGRMRSPGVLAAIDVFTGAGDPKRRMLVLLGSTVCLVLASGSFGVPLAIVTPMGIVGSLWVVPAATTWAEHAAGVPVGRQKWLVLVPALLHFAVSPFREHLVPIVLIPLLAYRVTHGRLPRRHIAAGVLAVPLFIMAGQATQAYRDVLWGGASFTATTDGAEQVFDQVVPPDPQWLVSIRRFHGLDSLLLTVDLVPIAFPHRDDAFLVDAIVRGLVPRAIMPSKVLSDRGPEFARTIWAYDSGIESSAAIAPSMPGDLYQSGATRAVLLGALAWGLLLGVIDRWKNALRPGGQVAILVLLATQVVPSVERDFAHCVATMLQTLVVIAVGGGLLGLFWRRRVADRVTLAMVEAVG
jgi:hypothetical protein